MNCQAPWEHTSPLGCWSPQWHCDKLLGTLSYGLKAPLPWSLVRLGPAPAAGSFLLQVSMEDTHTNNCCFQAGSNERTSPGFDTRWDRYFTFPFLGHHEHLSQPLATPVPKSKCCPKDGFFHLVCSQMITQTALRCLFYCNSAHSC